MTASNERRLRKDDTPESAKIWSDVDLAASRAPSEVPKYKTRSRCHNTRSDQSAVTVRVPLPHWVKPGEEVTVTVEWHATGRDFYTGLILERTMR